MLSLSRSACPSSTSTDVIVCATSAVNFFGSIDWGLARHMTDEWSIAVPLAQRTLAGFGADFACDGAKVMLVLLQPSSLRGDLIRE